MRSIIVSRCHGEGCPDWRAKPHGGQGRGIAYSERDRQLLLSIVRGAAGLNEPAHTWLKSVACQCSTLSARLGLHARNRSSAYQLLKATAEEFPTQFSCCDNPPLRNNFFIHLILLQTRQFALDFFAALNIGRVRCEENHALAEVILDAHDPRVHDRRPTDHWIVRARALARVHS
jgi:hypothetical protein